MQDLLFLCMDSVLVVFRLCCSTWWASLPHSTWDLSSWTRDWIHVPYIGRQILNHWPPGKSLPGGSLWLAQTACPITIWSPVSEKGWNGLEGLSSTIWGQEGILRRCLLHPSGQGSSFFLNQQAFEQASDETLQALLPRKVACAAHIYSHRREVYRID